MLSPPPSGSPGPGQHPTGTVTPSPFSCNPTRDRFLLSGLSRGSDRCWWPFQAGRVWRRGRRNGTQAQLQKPEGEGREATPLHARQVLPKLKGSRAKPLEPRSPSSNLALLLAGDLCASAPPPPVPSGWPEGLRGAREHLKLYAGTAGVQTAATPPRKSPRRWLKELECGLPSLSCLALLPEPQPHSPESIRECPGPILTGV